MTRKAERSFVVAECRFLIRRLATCGLVALAIVAHCLAASENPIRVRLDVTAEETLHSKLDDCLKSGLGAIDDVSVDPGASMVLRVIAIEQRTTTGDPLGYLLYEAGHVSVESEDPSAVVVKWERLLALPPDFPSACRKVVQDFEGEVIQTVRDAREEIRRKLGAR